MKILKLVAIVAGALSLLLAVISKITFQPIALLPGGLDASSFLDFANTCLLVAILLILIEKK